MEIKEILFTKTAEAVERYAVNNKLLGAYDSRTKEALTAFKAVHGVVAAAGLEADYQVWREQEQRTRKTGDEDADQGGLQPAT